MKNTIHNMKKFMVCLMLFASWQMMQAQVTTGSMAGVVRATNGETLPGATVIATHTPSGTTYGTTTSVSGNYNIQGMRVGGPYTLQVSFMGYEPRTIENITVSLGDAVNVNVALGEGALVLGGVTVVGDRGSAFSTERTGAATNISNREITRLPSINRNLTEVARLSPYSTGGSSFGGRETYMTNITVDGANFNNNFGLSNSSMPGVSGDPISMDAIEEMQVVIAPFDVRQSNFTGAGINAITKSGTNTVSGTVYGFFTNQDMGGKKINGNEIRATESSKQIYGFSAGAPIIKNKLFIFLNGEITNDLRPGNTLLASRNGGISVDDPNISNTVRAEDLEAFSNFLRNNGKFSYETGRYEDWGGDRTSNNKMLARLDWNAHKDHKVTFRYNYSKSQNVSRPSASGDANPVIGSGLSRHSKTSGMSFENSQYFNEATLHSITGELNSRFSNQLSNNLLIAYTRLDQPRSSNSSIFPMIDIMRGEELGNNPYMTAGYELFTYGNHVKNNTLIITNNATYQHGQHTFTGGLSFEHQYFANGYLRNGTGHYRYKNLQAFMNHVNGVGDGLPWNSDYHPLNFAYTYPINGYTEPFSELSFGQFSIYGQDEWAVHDNLRLTLGLRMDIPMYFDGALDNPLTHGLKFRDDEMVDLGKWPDAKMLWSPRFGFNWDINGDRSVTLRGGTGIFTGRIPFVWFTNQPGNSGMLQYLHVVNQNGSNFPFGADESERRANARDLLARLPFESDVRQLLSNPALASDFPQSNVAAGRLAVIDKDFKLPQVWRTSLATDIRLPLNMMLTFEAIYSKDINAIAFDNINIKNPDSVLREGSLERDYYFAGAQPYLSNSFTDVIVMRNTNKGHSFSFSTQLKMPYWKGFSGDIAYTFSRAIELTAKNGSDPYSAWRFRQSLNTLNAAEVGFTINNTPHRVMASVSYHVEYAKHFATTISLFYQGQTGEAYSYTYAGRPTNDGGVGTYLAYLPKEQSEVIWQEINGDGGRTNWEAYKWFAANDPYVMKNLGKYAGRYDAYLPWNSRLDLRIAQDFKIKVGNTVNRLQFTADILNFANLLNSNWGINKELQTANRGFPILNFVGRDPATGKAIVSMNRTTSGGPFYTSAHRDPGSQAATWAIQLGLRYTF